MRIMRPFLPTLARLTRAVFTTFFFFARFNVQCFHTEFAALGFYLSTIEQSAEDCEGVQWYCWNSTAWSFSPLQDKIPKGGQVFSGWLRGLTPSIWLQTHTAKMQSNHSETSRHYFFLWVWTVYNLNVIMLICFCSVCHASLSVRANSSLCPKTISQRSWWLEPIPTIIGWRQSELWTSNVKDKSFPITITPI